MMEVELSCAIRFGTAATCVASLRRLRSCGQLTIGNLLVVWRATVIGCIAIAES
jgi:hypothetical protein